MNDSAWCLASCSVLAPLSALHAAHSRAAHTLSSALAVHCAGPCYASAGDCEGRPLLGVVASVLRGLQNRAQQATRKLSLRGAPAIVVALVAALVSGSSPMNANVGSCHLLVARLDEFLDTSPSQVCLHEAELAQLCGLGLLQGASILRSNFWAISTAAARLIDGPHGFGSKFFRHNSGYIATLQWLVEGLMSQTCVDCPLRAAEVGVRRGDSAVAMLAHFSQLEIILIDPYHYHFQSSAVEAFNEMRPQLGSKPGRLEFKTDMETMLQRMEVFRDRATLILQKSSVVAPWITPFHLDYVFIDGDHSYEQVGQDVALWWPRVRVGGLLVGHDYVVAFPGVVRAVNEFAIDKGLRLFLAPELWWFKKEATGNRQKRGRTSASSNATMVEH